MHAGLSKAMVGSGRTCQCTCVVELPRLYGNHGLGVETGSWTRTEFSLRKCARCTSAGIADAPVDDTHHV
jgi:hypothetical protein